MILVLNRVAPKIPGVLVAVVGAIAVTVAFDLGAEGVSLVGTLPQGFPPFTVPGVELADLGLLVAGALGITLVSLTDTISTSSAFAARTGQEVDANQEMIGIGTANLAAGLFQGFPVSTSGSRTAVAEQAGAKSQLTGVVGAAAIIAMLLFAPGLMRNLPQPVLASVVIAASISLADIPATRRLWNQRRMEFGVSMAAFAGVALLGVLPGIGIAVAISILNVFRRMWMPYRVELAEVEGLDGYHDLDAHPEGVRIPGLVIFRFDAPLVFANSRSFREEIRAPRRHRAHADVDPDRGRADHRRRHHGGRHARGPRRGAQRGRGLAGVRRDEDAGAGQDRALRADPDHQPGPLLPHARRRGRGVPGPARIAATERRTNDDGSRHRPGRRRRRRLAAVAAIVCGGSAVVLGAVALAGDLGRAVLAPC